MTHKLNFRKKRVDFVRKNVKLTCMIPLAKKLQTRYKLNLNKPVFVYKNLHRDCWSVKQDGLVKTHAQNITMHSCTFKVNQNGREKVLTEKRKNVHAGVLGYIEKWIDLDWEKNHSTARPVTYNPYKYKNFVDKDTEQMVDYAIAVKLEGNHVLAVL